MMMMLTLLFAKVSKVVFNAGALPLPPMGRKGRNRTSPMPEFLAGR